MARYPLSDVFRWAYKPQVNFYFEVKNDSSDAENFVFTFLTQEVRVLGCCICVFEKLKNTWCSWGLLVQRSGLSLNRRPCRPLIAFAFPRLPSPPLRALRAHQGVHISDLLTDYAMALLREMGLNPDGTQRAPRPVHAAAAASSSGSAAGTGLYTSASTPTAAPTAAASVPAYVAPAPAPEPEPEPEPVAAPEPAAEEPQVRRKGQCVCVCAHVCVCVRGREGGRAACCCCCWCW
jgi:hypothetical protein